MSNYQYEPDSVEQAAYAVISELLPEAAVIYARQNHELPDGVVCTLETLVNDMVGRPEFGAVDENGVQLIHQVMQGTLTVKIYRGQSQNLANNFRLRTNKQTARDLMRRENFIIYSAESPVAMPEWHHDGVFYIPHSVIDVKFRYTARYTDDVGLIELINNSGNIGGAAVSFDVKISNPEH